MIVTTTQEFALVAAGCCPCDLPACEAPRKQCQSITVDACGETLPEFEGVTAEQRCIIFKKIESRILVRTDYVNAPYSYFFEPGFYNGFDSRDDRCARIFAFAEVDDERICQETEYAKNSETQNVTAKLRNEDETVVYTFIYSASGEGTSTSYSGSFSSTETYPPDDPLVESGPIYYSGCITLTPDETYTYSELVFTNIETARTSYTETVPNPDEDPEDPDDDTMEEEVGSETITTTKTVTYSLPVELADLTAEIDAVKALLGTDDWPDKACQSVAVYNYGYPDPELDEEGEPIPPTPILDENGDPLPPVPAEPVCTQISSVTRARYRMGIPATSRWDAVTAAWNTWDKADPETRGEAPLKTTFDEAHAAWVTAKAEWDAANPETRGPEPLEPTKRTFFEIQWDEVFFPAAWDAWRALRTTYEIALAAHEAWEADETDPKPPEPTIPEDPGEAPTPAPTLTASRSWSYAGAADFSPWYEIEIPTVVGETRIVNTLTKCYRSARLGALPTAHGEIYELPA